MAGHLARMLATRADKRKHRRRRIAWLRRQDVPVDRAAVKARRRAGLQAADTRMQFAQSRGQRIARWSAGATALLVYHAGVGATPEQRAGGQGMGRVSCREIVWQDGETSGGVG